MLEMLIRLVICIAVLFYEAVGQSTFHNLKLLSHEMHPQASTSQIANECNLYCNEHISCEGFFTHPDYRHHNRHNCYLESAKFREIKNKMPESALYPIGKEHQQQGDSVAATFRSIRGPLVVDVNMVVNLEQHFVRGCSYTISLWVWLNEPAKRPVNEIPVFTTRDLQTARSQNEHEETIQPSVVFNVGDGADGRDPNAFFFSAFKDENDLFHGFWAQGPEGKVRFGEWTHISVVLLGQRLSGYVNGVLIGSSDLMASRQSQGEGSNVDGVMMCPYTFPTKGNFNQPYHPRLALNNTLIQILGATGGRREVTPGMVQDVIVIRNKALRPGGDHESNSNKEVRDGIHNLMNIRPPIALPSLSKLALAYGKECKVKQSLHKDGPLGEIWALFDGRALEMCPEKLCGKICLNHNLADGNYKYYRKQWHHKEMKKWDRQGGLRRTGAGEGSEVATLGEANVVEPLSETETADASYVSGAFGTSDASDFYQDQDLEDHPGSPGSALKAKEPDAGPARDGREDSAWAQRTELAISELYDSAMQWLHGNIHNSKEHILALGAIYQSSQEIYNDFRAKASTDDEASEYWRQAVYERSFSALVMALWLASDLDLALPAVGEPWWNYRYANMQQQPLQLALAYHQGVSKIQNASMPPDLGRFLKETLRGLDVMQYIRTGADTINTGTDTSTGKGVVSIEVDINGVGTSSVENAFSEEEARQRSMQGELLVAEPQYSSIDIYHWLHALSKLDTQGYFRQVNNGTHFTVGLDPLLLPVVKSGLLTEADLCKADAGCSSGFPSGKLLPELVKTHPDMVELLRKYSAYDRFDMQLQHYEDSECIAAVAHYFSVSQYVTAHYGTVDNGITALEDVRIMSADLDQHAGLEANDHEYNVMEANEGNPHAQMYLARRYFWGQGGVRPDPEEARRWFEAAAAQNHPEGLYNLGVLYANGQLGYPVNSTKAIELFKAAADPITGEPAFPMALYAVGTHYQNSIEEKNINKAISYYVRACATGSPDAHFSLFFIYQSGEGEGNHVNIPLAVHHLTEAVSGGHVRATNFLAHGLYDPESWLAGYGRESTYVEMHGLDKLVPHARAEYSSSTTLFEPISGTQWMYNKSEPFRVQLPVGVVELPVPLGTGDGCAAALHLFKHLAFMSYKPNDLSRAALEEYLEHFDPRNGESLKLYDEAADLGIPHAQENSMYLYKLLRETECVPESMPGWLDKKQCLQYLEFMLKRRLVQLANNGDVFAKRELAYDLLKRKDEENMRDRERERKKLEVQNEYNRNIAAKQTNREGDVVNKAAELFVLGSEQGDVQSLMGLGWVFVRDDAPFKNRTIALSIFKAVVEWENQLQDQAEAYPMGYSSTTTHGLASFLAELYIRLDEWVENIGLKSIEAVLRGWKYLYQAIFNEICALYSTIIGAEYNRSPGAPSVSFIYNRWSNRRNGIDLSWALLWNVLAFVFLFVIVSYRNMKNKDRQFVDEEESD